jgi:hypothetical protein
MDGKILLSRRVANDEPELLQLIIISAPAVFTGRTSFR